MCVCDILFQNVQSWKKNSKPQPKMHYLFGLEELHYYGEKVLSTYLLSGIQDDTCIHLCLLYGSNDLEEDNSKISTLYYFIRNILLPTM